MIMNTNPDRQSAQNYNHLLQFKSSVLVKGQRIEAYVVWVGDGPLSFYVMQKNDYEVVCPLLLKKINSFPMYNIRSNIIPGRPCLAFDLNNVLCRGIIVAIKDSEADVYFVDFGYTHGVSWDKIFDIHCELLLPKTMAVRLKLSKLTRQYLTADAKRIFTELLTDDVPLVLLDVSESEEPGVQFAEVYVEEHGKFLNIKERMMASFDKILLSSGDTYEAVIEYCSSMNDVYVRLLTECNVVALSTVMSELQTYYSNTSMYLSLCEMYAGMPVAVLDSDNKWQRAVIMVEPKDYKTISVYFVDYGKYALVHGQNLQALDRKFLRLRAQAIYCNVLEDSNEAMKIRMKQFRFYSDFIVGKEIILKVENLSSAGIPIVQLIDRTGSSVISVFRQLLQSSLISPLSSPLSTGINDVLESAGLHPASSCSGKLKEGDRADDEQKANVGSSINNEHTPHIESNVINEDKKLEKSAGTANVNDDVSNNDNRLNEQSCDNKALKSNLYVERWLQTNDFSAKYTSAPYEGCKDWANKSFYESAERKTSYSQRSRKSVEQYINARNESESDGDCGYEIPSSAKKQQEVELINDRLLKCGFFEIQQTVGSTHQVTFGQFNNPHSFYAHIINSEYEDMMNDMQQWYTDERESLRKDEIYVGDTVVVAEESGTLKRARVISLINTEKYIKVNFVDFGNDYDCVSNDIWTISAEHCEVPIMAIYCRLNNVIPPIGNNWSSNFDSRCYFNNEKFTLKIVDRFTDDLGRNVYEVELFDLNGRDVAEWLINDSYCRTRSGLEEPVNLDSLIGQYTTLYVPRYESSEKFTVHLEPENVATIENKLKEISNDATMLSKLTDEEVTYETHCLVRNEDLYRGLILSVKYDIRTVKVLYIDYGHEDEVSWDKLFVLQKNLTYYHGQAYHCSLYGTEKLSQEQNDILKHTVEKQNLIAYVNKVHNHKLLLTLYHADGTPLSVTNGECKGVMISPLIPLRILRPQTMVTITSVQIEEDGVVTAYIMHQCDKGILEKLQKSLHDFYSGQAQITNNQTLKLPTDRFRVGMHCLSSISRWPHWRRCKIVELREIGESNGVDTKVLFVDYGIEMYVRRCSSLFTLNEQFYFPNELCLKVDTGLIVKNANEATSRSLVKNLTNTDLMVEFSERSNVAGSILWNIKLADNEYVVERLPELAAYKNFDETTAIEGIELNDDDIVQRWFRAGELSVEVVHAESPTSFWIHLTEDLPRLDELENSLRERLKTILPTPLNNLNEMFAFKRKDSNVWHRGISVSPTAVRSADSGYLVTEVDKLVVKILPYRFKRAIPPFSVECSLDVQVDQQRQHSSIDDKWSLKAVQKFEQLTKDVVSENHSSSLLTGKIVALKDDRQIIRLLSNGADVGLSLIKENLATAKRHPVIVSEITSIERFFTVNEESLNQMDKLFEQLNSPQFHQCETDLTKEEIKCGDTVLVKSPKTAQWLRAVILSTGGDDDAGDYFVESIDIGNRFHCSQIKRLPRQFSLIPPFATECCLNVSKLQEEVTSSDAIDYEKIEQFIRYHSQQCWAKFTMICCAYEKPLLVDLYVNNNDVVADVLFQKDQMDAMAEGSTFSANFIISHSPGDFYIQLTKNMDAEEISELLRNMVDQCSMLDNNSSVAVGSLVAAQFPDTDWYRAKLLKILPDDMSYEVISIDVGITCIVSNVKVLPENLLSLLPPLAIHCSLELPEEFTDWPEWFCDQFEYFTQDKSELEIKLIKKGDPNVVLLPAFEVNRTDVELAINSDADNELVDDSNSSYLYIDHDIPIELINKKSKKKRVRKRRGNNSDL